MKDNLSNDFTIIFDTFNKLICIVYRSANTASQLNSQKYDVIIFASVVSYFISVGLKEPILTNDRYVILCLKSSP